MIIDTPHLFFALLRNLKVSLVFDIGSRDGLQSLQIRKSLPNAKIIAFEANPANYHYMTKNRMINKNNIEIHNLAMTNYNGNATFNIYKDYKADLSGLSSLYKRDDLELDKSIEVKTRRLDDFVIERNLIDNNIGLWIDVEGAEFQVLEGIVKLKEKICIIHVEVGSKIIFESEQRTKNELLKLMNSYGFVEAGISFDEKKISFGNVVFVSTKYLKESGLNLGYYRYKTFVLRKVREIFLFTKNRFPSFYKKCKHFYIKYFLK